MSLAFAVGRILAFEPAPGFGYHVYRFNTLGILSDAAIARATIVATTTLSWFGLYEWARTDAPTPKALSRVVFVILLANSAAMVVQRYVDPGFLLPAGPVPPGRLNGVTSFCYALGSAVIALYLLLPAWGARRGVSGLLTAGSLVFLTHAMVASGSRTSLGVMLAAALAWGVLWAARFNRERRRGLAALSAAALAVLLSAAAAAYVVVTPGEETSLGRLKFWVEKEGLFGHLVATRLTSYPLAVRVMLEYPLSGVGVGLYMAEASKQHELLMPDLRIDPFLLTSYAPNQFLNTGVELGIPALVALVAAFAAVAVNAGRQGREASHLVVSVVVLAAALQLGPDLYNSESVVFFCLILGLAARRSSTSAEARGPAPGAVGTRAATAVLGAIAVVAIAGHLLSLPLLSVDSQWKRLRWRMTAGMHPRRAAGDGGARRRPPSPSTPRLRGSSSGGTPGTVAVRDYRARVSFYVDGTLVERSVALPGQVRETWLPLRAGRRLQEDLRPGVAPVRTRRGLDRGRSEAARRLHPLGDAGGGEARISAVVARPEVSAAVPPRVADGPGQLEQPRGHARLRESSAGPPTSPGR